jgi:hypothetical protein
MDELITNINYYANAIISFDWFRLIFYKYLANFFILNNRQFLVILIFEQISKIYRVKFYVFYLLRQMAKLLTMFIIILADVYLMIDQIS